MMITVTYMMITTPYMMIRLHIYDDTPSLIWCYCTPKIFAAIWLDDTYPIIQILDSNDLTSYRSKRRNGFADKVLRWYISMKIFVTSRVIFVILKVRFVTSVSKTSWYLVRCYRMICHCPPKWYKHKLNKVEISV